MLLLHYHWENLRWRCLIQRWHLASCICWEVPPAVINIGNWAPLTACHCGHKTSVLSRAFQMWRSSGTPLFVAQSQEDNGITQQRTDMLTHDGYTCVHTPGFTNANTQKNTCVSSICPLFRTAVVLRTSWLCQRWQWHSISTSSQNTRTSLFYCPRLRRGEGMWLVPFHAVIPHTFSCILD